MRKPIAIWAALPAVLLTETAVCAVLTAAALDLLVRRPVQGGGSITTLFPGFAYACATVTKVCLAGVVAAAAAGVARRLGGGSPQPIAMRDLPLWGIASLAVTPATPLLGALVVLGAQGAGFAEAARSGVFAMLTVLAGGALAGAVSLMRRERPATLPVLGLAINAALVVLFVYFRFYALGFDQDRWANG